MVAITRNQRNKLDQKISILEKDRFASDAATIIKRMSKTKNMLDRFTTLFELIEFLNKPENKLVFDCSEFQLFKMALYSNCLDYSRYVPLAEDKKFLFSPFVV